MPQIKIEKIVSFTSEDASCPASNLLLTDPAKKWKCKTPGERSASVIFQLDQPYLITGIDIGNENSAYIEVLVNRASSSDDYKVLLIMSSLMSPLEARQNQNINKVRMFKQNDLNDGVKDEKWDRIKIVCTQPFNRHVQYGLSFINLYTSDGKVGPQTAIGKFTLRAESPDNISPGSLFARIKQQKDNPQENTLKGAAAIRDAANSSRVPTPKQKHNLPSTPNLKRKPSLNTDDAPPERKDRNRNELLYSKDEEEKHDKIDKLIDKRNEEKAQNSKKEQETSKAHKKGRKDALLSDKTEKESKRKAPASPAHKTPGRVEAKASASKRQRSSESKVKAKKPKKLGKPFAKLLEGVVLVISGIQNPDRASLRSMALSMGAKYKPDWDNSCTHLICAFRNTPKFNQVKGHGKIVTRRWLEDCYNNRKRIPWRRHALDPADQGQESEVEICEEDEVPQSSPEQAEALSIHSDSDDDMKEQGSDTDEKIEQLKKKKRDQTTESSDIFNVDTDDEDECKIHDDLEIKDKLPDFFQDKMFYVDESLSDEIQQTTRQYIAAYDGILTDNLERTVDIIVTKGDNSKVLQEICPSSICIAPDWIWECHNTKKLVPMKGYIFE